MPNFLALDVGTKRIGMAFADSTVPIAMPVRTLVVDGTEVNQIRQFVRDKSIDTVVVGYPRNQSGDSTAQTEVSEQFSEKISSFVKVELQDESLTSVLAEDRLKADGKPYDKADIDAMAAAIILQDYLERLERQHGR